MQHRKSNNYDKENMGNFNNLSLPIINYIYNFLPSKDRRSFAQTTNIFYDFLLNFYRDLFVSALFGLDKGIANEFIKEHQDKKRSLHFWNNIIIAITRIPFSERKRLTSTRLDLLIGHERIIASDDIMFILLGGNREFSKKLNNNHNDLKIKPRHLNNFSHYNFSSLDLRKITFKGFKFNNADFHGADLTDACFIDCELNEINFTDAKLKETGFIDVRLSKIILTRAKFDTICYKSLSAYNNKLTKNNNGVTSSIEISDFIIDMPSLTIEQRIQHANCCIDHYEHELYNQLYQKHQAKGLKKSYTDVKRYARAVRVNYLFSDTPMSNKSIFHKKVLIYSLFIFSKSASLKNTILNYLSYKNDAEIINALTQSIMKDLEYDSKQFDFLINKIMGPLFNKLEPSATMFSYSRLCDVFLHSDEVEKFIDFGKEVNLNKKITKCAQSKYVNDSFIDNLKKEILVGVNNHLKSDNNSKISFTRFFGEKVQRQNSAVNYKTQLTNTSEPIIFFALVYAMLTNTEHVALQQKIYDACSDYFHIFVNTKEKKKKTKLIVDHFKLFIVKIIETKLCNDPIKIKLFHQEVKKYNDNLNEGNIAECQSILQQLLKLKDINHSNVNELETEEKEFVLLNKNELPQENLVVLANENTEATSNFSIFKMITENDNNKLINARTELEESFTQNL